MIQYIGKSALVAEIERRRKEVELNCGGYKSYDEHRCDNCTVGFYEEFLEILNALEVKEVDLEKEVNTYMDNEMKFLSDEVGYDTLLSIAHYFFELGLKAQKGE